MIPKVHSILLIIRLFYTVWPENLMEIKFDGLILNTPAVKLIFICINFPNIICVVIFLTAVISSNYSSSYFKIVIWKAIL